MGAVSGERPGGAVNAQSAAWNEAVGIMRADGVSLDDAASLALTAMGDGRDPVAWARKYVRLRAAARALREP
jgi:hypothetical protein